MTATDTRPTVAGVRAELLDCVQANLAVLADAHHGPGTHLALGRALRLRHRPDEHGLPTVEQDLDGQLADARDLLGLAVSEHRTGVPGASLAAGSAAVRFVVADAFHLPWAPYHQQRHMTHSFLLLPATGGERTVLDAYHNDTEWGAARPGEWRLTQAELAAATPDGATVLEFTAGPLTPATPSDVDFAGHVEGYLRPYVEHRDRAAALDALTLQTWLLARSRRLHAVATGRDGDAAAHLAAWDELGRRTYLARRRVERGYAEPPGVTDRLAELLHADTSVFAPVTATGVDAATVARVVAEVLAVPVAAVTGTALSDLPGFSSFRLVEIVERLERELSIEFDPADLVPERIGTLDGLREAAGNAREW